MGGGSTALQPAVWQDTRRAAVDFSTDGLKPGPDLVPFATPHRFTDDHVAVVALVAGGDG